MAAHLIDLTGRQFGQLTVVERIGKITYDSKHRKHKATCPTWLTRCSHGHEDVRSGASLRISGSGAKCKQCYAGRQFGATLDGVQNEQT